MPEIVWFLKLEGSFSFTQYNNDSPILINTNNEWGNIYEWNRLKDRDLTKPLIKFDGETFWEVIEWANRTIKRL